jgi:hypothetical protein
VHIRATAVITSTQNWNTPSTLVSKLLTNMREQPESIQLELYSEILFRQSLRYLGNFKQTCPSSSDSLEPLFFVSSFLE